MTKQSFLARISNFLKLSIIIPALTIIGCEEIPKEVEITHQRELCKFDENEALRGTINRFSARQPLHWRRIPGTKHRLLNYRSAKNTEIALGVVSGSVSSNVIRWYGQFGQKDKAVDISTLQQGTMLGNRPYYFVEMKGNFKTNMGGQAIDQENWALLAIICKANDEELITIKMTGPQSELAKEKEHILNYAHALKIISFTEGSEDNQNKNDE